MGLWSGIKHAINSTLGTAGFSPLDEIVKTRADQTTVDVINNTKLGATNNTGGTATAGTVMAKLNAILGYSLAPRVVKSVQRGTFFFDQSSPREKIFPINSVNPAKSLVLINGLASSGNIVIGSLYVAGLTSSALTIKHNLAVSTSQIFDWQVIEFY